MRYVVAPAPTGSSTQGLPILLHTAATSSMDSTSSGDRVPQLMLTTEAMAANSGASSFA